MANFSSAGITAVGKLGDKSEPTRDRDQPDLFLNVGGLEEIEKKHPFWLQCHKLVIGDEVTIKLIETDSPDLPQTSSTLEELQKEEHDTE